MSTSDGVEVAAHDLGGAGPALVLVHAAGLHGLVFGPLARHLADDFHCVSLDGRAIPQDQTAANPSLGTIVFDPGPGKDIQEFTKGGHSAVLEWWPSRYPTAEAARAERQLRSYSWSFNVG